MKRILAITTAIGISGLSLALLASRVAETIYCYDFPEQYCIANKVQTIEIGEGVTKIEIKAPTAFKFVAKTSGRYQFTSWYQDASLWSDKSIHISGGVKGEPETIYMDKGTDIYLTFDVKNPSKPRKVSIQIIKVGK